MDAEQKYTEVEFTNFQVDSEFLYKLDDLPRPYGIQIAHQLNVNANTLPEKMDGYST